MKRILYTSSSVTTSITPLSLHITSYIRTHTCTNTHMYSILICKNKHSHFQWIHSQTLNLSCHDTKTHAHILSEGPIITCRTHTSFPSLSLSHHLQNWTQLCSVCVCFNHALPCWVTNLAAKEAIRQPYTHTRTCARTQVRCVLWRLNITVASDDPNRFSSWILVRTCSRQITAGMRVKNDPDQSRVYVCVNCTHTH